MTEQATQEKHQRKVLTGEVVSAKMDKSVVVRVETVERHPVYKKVIKRYKKYYAHDEKNTAQEGQTVTIMETRPLSKTKRWRVTEAA